MHHSSLDNFNENNDITATWTTTIKGKTISTMASAPLSPTLRREVAKFFKSTNETNLSNGIRSLSTQAHRHSGPTLRREVAKFF